MIPVSPVIPEENIKELMVAENQPEYLDLPALRVNLPDDAPAPGRMAAAHVGNKVLLARWHMSEAERRVVAETGDVYIYMHTCGQPVMPMSLQVEKPEIVKSPLIMSAVRKSEKAAANAAKYDFETFEGECCNCSFAVLYTAASKETLVGNPQTRLFCHDCFKILRQQNPELEGEYLPNTFPEIEKILQNFDK